MPHATNDEAMTGGTGHDEDEKQAINAYLAGEGGGYGGEDVELNEIDQRDKADDAIDYEDMDLSEDELPDEEEATRPLQDDGLPGDGGAGGMGGHVNDDQDLFDRMANGMGTAASYNVQTNGHLEDDEFKPFTNGDQPGEASDLQDLFGEHSSSPEQQRPSLALPTKSSLALPGPHAGQYGYQPRRTSHQEASLSEQNGHDDDEEMEEEEEPDEDLRTQQKLFAAAKRRQQGEDVPDEDEEVDMADFWKCFPSFDPSENPNFVDLFRPRASHYKRKVPLKQPKPLLTTKVYLDLLADQERSFRAHKATEESSYRDGLIFCGQQSNVQDDSDDDLALSELDANERIGGVTTHDLIMLCEDWDIPSLGDENGSIEGDWEADELSRPRKKARTNILDTDLSMSLQHPELSFEEPEHATARIAKSVALDMNDPYLLIDDLERSQKHHAKHATGIPRRDGMNGRDFARRYNISNDEAYDLLKENHQHKIRSTVGSHAAEHSLPAARLQYPFYKIHLDNKQKRAFHRPSLELKDAFRKEFRFSKPRYVKRKHIKGKGIQDIFHKAEDLSVGDNSNVLLLEYSEEAPIMMSNFGMGNRLINYYRKKSADDQERPKRDIGDTQVLLEQDSGPFKNLGHVDKGEVVPTIMNDMFRAPVFNHQAKSTDFLVGVSSTYMSGHRFFIRNVDNLHTVGQQFPLAEVPTEHSRKVTNAAKFRLRSIAYRMWTKSQDPTRGTKRKPVTNDSLLPHLPGHDMPQLRSKMREFMKYEKAGKDAQGIWVPKLGEQVPDEQGIRNSITPVDICLLDAMQVGVQQLADLGFSSRGKEVEETDDLDEGANIELQLTPWQASRSFIQATSGKAMLKLHGEGDPTGRGEGFSFVKTSMKGGFEAPGESAQDKITAKKRRENGGHTYNVAAQDRAYKDYVRLIWDKQKASLSNDLEMSDVEADEEPEAPHSALPHRRAATPRSSFGTPAAFSQHDDESASQFSRGSANRGERVLTISRNTRDKFGNPTVEYEKVTNPRVIQLYRKAKMHQELMHSSFMDFEPTGDPELDNMKKQQIAKEIERVRRNAKRRAERETAKMKTINANGVAGSPGGPSDADGTDGTPQKAPGKGRNKDGTARKCANCGQVGHIKTNRKSVTFRCTRCLKEEYDPTPVTPGGKVRKRRADSAQPTAERVSAMEFAKSTYSAFQL